MTFQRLSCGVATLHHSHSLPLKPENKTGGWGSMPQGQKPRTTGDGWTGGWGSMSHGCNAGL